MSLPITQAPLVHAPERYTDVQEGATISAQEVIEPIGKLSLEHLQNEDDPETLRLVSQDLIRDFYQTFRLSQGEAAVQPPLFRMLADEYTKRYTPDYLSSALKVAHRDIPRLMPPVRHARTTAETRTALDSGFDTMWLEFTEAILQTGEGSVRSVELMLEDILAEESKYQDLGRPNRAPGQDIHESIVREYVLNGNLSGSKQLSLVCDTLRTTLLTAEDTGDEMDVFHRFRDLRLQWEANHPGESFFEGI